VLTAFVASSANAQRNRPQQATTKTPETPAFVPTAQGPKIEFEKLVHDYGQVVQGADGNAEFKFRNVGSEPLILSNVSASCGCTVPDWNRNPIMPGEYGSIKVNYTNMHIPGNIGRAITVHSNSVDNTERITLRLAGTVSPRNP
jgi:archaellum component FlaG (FlaF/FlaG flagellin family)